MNSQSPTAFIHHCSSLSFKNRLSLPYPFNSLTGTATKHYTNTAPSTRSFIHRRINPTCNIPPPPPPPQSNRRQQQQSSNTNWVSRSVFGRLLVELLSLFFGSLLLLIVVLWRLCQIISLNMIRILAWISNVRQLGKWAFSILAFTHVHTISLQVTSLSQTLNRIYTYIFTRSIPNDRNEQDDQDISSYQPAVDINRYSKQKQKRLILLRHAKAECIQNNNINDDIVDHQRKLSEKGRREATLIGHELKRIDWIPDKILSSNATRTIETLNLLNLPSSVMSHCICTDSLYFAVSANEMVSAIDHTIYNSLSDNNISNSNGWFFSNLDSDSTSTNAFHTLLVVCHNPGCEELVQQLTGENRPDMGTACAALLQYDNDDNAYDYEEPNSRSTSWKWSLSKLIRPSNLVDC